MHMSSLCVCPQELAALLQRLKAAGSRALIFTQMTRMLDVLEAFLNLHGHSYCRLDGSTKPEQRQVSLAHLLRVTLCVIHILIHFLLTVQ